MTDIVPEDQIEQIVGVPRHAADHIGRTVPGKPITVYILHSYDCLDTGIDLRDCPYSLALDNGIDLARWIQNIPARLAIVDDYLVPANYV